ncbi:MAG: hypothetical protein EB127_00200 [Alphaproteobacteria bacterium]|nr:hypothetical protein [Alphaproteobacteria bacterium]
MSDALKTAVNLVQSFTFSDGMQPSAKQFENIFNGLSEGLNIFSSVVGPALNSSVSVLTKNRVVSSNKYNSMMGTLDRLAFESNVQDAVLNTFNITRILGSHSSLNPLYLPGSVHLVASQSSGYPLATDVKVQQLPFPPIDEYSFEIDDDGRTWVQVASAAEAAAATAAYSFYMDPAGTIYTNRLFKTGATIKYDLKIPNTYGPLGSGYNVIPDLSIETLSDEDVLSRTGDGSYGRVSLSLKSTGADYSEWTLVLPPVISLKDPLLTTSTLGVDNQGFEPLGVFESSNGKKYYGLNSELYLESAGGLIDNNTLVLFDSESGKSYFLNWTSANLAGEEAKRTFYASGSSALLTLFKNDAGNLISSNGGSNTKNFYIFAFGTNISDTLAQVNLNFAKHKHNGSDSNRVHHRDLLGTENGLQGFGSQTGSYNGLDFVSYNRQLAFSNIEDNVHPQYFHRLGFLQGGTAGKYSDTHLMGYPLAKKVDWNFLHGDMVFSPIEKVSRPMLYENSGDSSADPDKNKIDWDLNIESVESRGTKSLGNLRGHSLMFGVPLIMNQTAGSNPDGDLDLEPSYNGAVRVSYENGIFYNDTLYDVTNQKYRLSKHGFIPGDETGIDGNFSPAFRGLNIGWGNLFFGHREDIFGGRMSGMFISKTEASAFWRTAEFNIITTANSQAGKNTNSKIKEGYNYRDGFNVRALKGSSIWLSTGAESPDVTDIASGKNSINIPGTIALEASYPSSRGTILGSDTGVLSLNTLVSSDPKGDTIGSGSGIFLAPGPFIDTAGADSYRNPWVAATLDDYKFASLWDSSSLGPVIDGSVLDGFNAGPGPMLDIFALAPDRQKTNINSAGEIPVGTDASLLGWVFGRPFVRGTYGINFCVNGNSTDMHDDFKTGYKRKVLDEDWGPTRAILKTTTNEYIHREFKFWGKNYNDGPSASTDSTENTMGGNINLLYNFGRDYKRFGLNQVWSDDTSLSGGGVGSSGNAQWANSRRISLGSSKPEDYGSAIRQASYVEAFKGFRNDPIQPYYANYIIPFTASYNLGELTEIDIQEQISKKTFVLADSINGMPALTYMDAGYVLVQLENVFNDVTLDGLIRGSEEILLQSTNTVTGAFPSSLVDFKVKLEYYVGQKADGSSTNTGTAESPHIFGGYYNRIATGFIAMEPAAQAKVSGTIGGGGNLIPIVASSNGKYDPIDSAFNQSSIVGYSSAIGVVKNTNIGNSSSGYRSNFPLFETIGRGNLMGQKQFCLLLNIHDRTTESYAINSPVPYQIIKDGANHLIIKFRGTIHLTAITAYSRNPYSDNYPA